MGAEIGRSSAPATYGPGGEYCRVCRAAAEEKEQQERQALAQGPNGAQAQQPVVSVSLPRGNVLGSVKRGGDLDVVAVPFVFRYLCAELASMGINVSLEIQ